MWSSEMQILVSEVMARRIFKRFVGIGALPSNREWYLIANADKYDRQQWEHWYQSTVNDVPVALVSKPQIQWYVWINEKGYRFYI